MKGPMQRSKCCGRTFLFVALTFAVLMCGHRVAAQAVHGTGTAGRIPLWTSGSTIGNSSMSQSGANISVGGGLSVAGGLSAGGAVSAPLFTGAFTGTFTGNGSGVTNVNAATLGGFSASQFAQVGISNTFLANQIINGNLSLTGSLALPNTDSTGSLGVISFGGNPVLHNFDACIGGCGINFTNIFVGNNAGNFSVGGGENTAIGSRALLSATTGGGNTALGFEALFNNTIGYTNIATGVDALYSNTEGYRNIAIGLGASYNNSKGNSNIAIGLDALYGDTTGSGNIAIGTDAGFNVSAGINNIYIGGSGGGDESGTIRVGVGGVHNSTFIAGIYNVATGGAGTQVLVDVNGQLGTISSSRRSKYDIEDMGEGSSDLVKLRPVTFRYKQAQDNGSHPLQYGLIAEEVADVYPGLVAYDKAGEPQTVLYHVLPAMLLNEVQKQQRQIEALEKLIQSQQEQLEAQEGRLRKLAESSMPVVGGINPR